MKTLLTLILFLILRIGIGQDYILIKNYDTIWRDSLRIDWEPIKYELPKDTFIQESKYRWYNAATWTYIDSSYYFHQMTHLINAWKVYQQECEKDTIKTVQYENEYIIWHDGYGEMVTERQLNEKGYKYHYRWLIKTDPFEFEYIFIKEPTMKDFMQYLERRLK